MLRGSTASRGRRPAILLAAAGTAALIGFAGQPAQAASTTTDPAEAAAGWLAEQLVDGERFEQDFGGDAFPDQGLTLDAVLAFMAAGVSGDHTDAAMAWLATPDVVDNYLGHEFDSRFAAGYSKLAFAVSAYGLDASAFGGVDLLAGLRDLRDADGQFSDDSDFTDLSNTFSQSFAILALVDTADGVPPAAVDFLASEQCADGGFPLNFGEPDCVSGVDTTAMAVPALLATGRDQVAASALDWLTGVQEASGGFSALPGAGDPTDPGINANSTGLAAQALRTGGRDAEADDAVTFLQSLQVGCDSPPDERGAVHHTAGDPGDVLRATTQAVLGLAGVGMGDLDGSTARPEAPRLDCDPEPSPSPSPSLSPSPSPAPTGTAPPGGSGGEQLPVTGSPVLALVGTGVVLLSAGGVTMWATQRRRRNLPESTG